MSTDHPVRSPSGSGFARKVAIFGLPAVAGYLVALVPAGSAVEPRWIIAAGALLTFAALTTALLPWDRVPHALRALPPVAYIGVIALMRMGTGGTGSEYLPLLLLPLAWFALYGSRGQLLTGFGAVAAVLFLTGSPTGEGIAQSLLALIVVPAVCGTIQRLAAKVRRQAAMLEDLTNTDRLTGATTKRAWEAALARELVRAARTGDALAVAFIDFDDFNQFNERFGADAGDDVIRRSVAAWRRELRAGDLLGRMDGDGFAVALPACTAEQAHEVVERLRVATTDLQTCSIGLAEWTEGESAERLMERALAATGAAKQQGRDRSVTARRPVAEGPAAGDPDDGTTPQEAAARARSLIAELHAVAEASATTSRGARGEAGGEGDTPDAESPDAGETPGTEALDHLPEDNTPEDDLPDGDSPQAPSEARWDPEPGGQDGVPGAEDTSAGDPSADPPAPDLALVAPAEGTMVTVGDDLDDVLAVRGATEIHKLLRDLSSTR